MLDDACAHEMQVPNACLTLGCYIEIHLEASQATLLAAEEQASAARAWLAESYAMVAGKMNSKKTLISISTVFVLIAPLFL